MRLLIPCLLLLLAGAGCRTEAPGPRPLTNPPIVVIGLDTVRGDHLRVAGMEGIETPHLDALAADGVYFARCQSTAPWTGPSFASLYTGLLPYRHGFIGGNYAGLDSSLTTMAEILRGEGYVTGGFVAVKWLTRKFGMAQGLREHQAYYLGRDGSEAREVTSKGQRFAGRHHDEPFFLFLHYYDAHAPYEPPQPFDRYYYGGDERAPGGLLLDVVLSERNDLPLEKRESGMYDWLEGITDWEYPDRQYAAEITFVDDQVGQVIADLKKRGLYHQALIVAVGDHGEHLTEHDIYYTHALPYEETLHVPLIIKWPGREFAGTRVDRRVSITDVLPTVLAATGRPVPAGLDGVDLHGLAHDPRADYAGSLVAEHGGPRLWHKTLTEGEWKLFLTAEQGEITRRLFHLGEDPGELLDVARDHPERVAAMTRRLWEICGGPEKLVDRPPVGTDKIDEKTREQLRSLGYIR